MTGLVEEAERVFLEKHGPKTWFERAIFFSWYCSTRHCKFCYMSSQNADKMARRTLESLLAEVVLCRRLGWQIGFVSGGQGAYTTVQFENILRHIHLVAKEKLWINVGALDKNALKKYKPYTKGVVASVETVNPRIHDFVCPSKPIEPFVEMLENAESLGFKKAMTIILGLGESLDDFDTLKRFIRKYDVGKIHFYSLNPQKGTYFEDWKRPSAAYQAEWIARTRIAFPRMDIQAGIWLDCVDRVALLLKAGANSISKFPATRYFNSPQARTIESQAKKAGRSFVGTLTKVPRGGYNTYLNCVSGSLRKKTGERLAQYVRRMQPHSRNHILLDIMTRSSPLDQ
jgi:biotin synthase-like enzyme